MIHLNNRGWNSEGALWENLRLGLEMLIESASWLPLVSVVSEVPE